MFNQTSGCHNYIIMHFLEFPIAFQFVYVVIIDLIILFANATNGICIVRTNMGCRKNCWPAATSEILILNCTYVIHLYCISYTDNCFICIYIYCMHLVHLQVKHINCLGMQTISQAVTELSLEANLIFAFNTN